MHDDPNRPMTKQDAEAWMAEVVGELTGRRGTPEGGTPAPAAPPPPARPEDGEEHPVLSEAREIEARRAQDAEQVRLARLYLAEKGDIPEAVVAALTDDEVRGAAGLGEPLSIDAESGDPAANAQRAVRPPGESSLMSAEERQRRRDARELTVDPGVIRYRKEREGA
jgi:hypothetical protein